MALINCLECKKEISDKAKTCPNCGYPVDFQNKVTSTPQEVSSLKNDVIPQFVQKIKYDTIKKKYTKLSAFIKLYNKKHSSSKYEYLSILGDYSDKFGFLSKKSKRYLIPDENGMNIAANAFLGVKISQEIPYSSISKVLFINKSFWGKGIIFLNQRDEFISSITSITEGDVDEFIEFLNKNYNIKIENVDKTKKELIIFASIIASIFIVINWFKFIYNYSSISIFFSLLAISGIIAVNFIPSLQEKLHSNLNKSKLIFFDGKSIKLLSFAFVTFFAISTCSGFFSIEDKKRIAVENHNKQIQKRKTLQENEKKSKQIISEANVKFKQNDKKSAYELYVQASKLKPLSINDQQKSLEIAYSLGIQNQSLNKLENAVSFYKQILEWKPDYKDVKSRFEKINNQIIINKNNKKYNVAYNLQSKGKINEALEEYKNLQSISPNYKDVPVRIKNLETLLLAQKDAAQRKAEEARVNASLQNNSTSSSSLKGSSTLGEWRRASDREKGYLAALMTKHWANTRAPHLSNSDLLLKSTELYACISATAKTDDGSDSSVIDSQLVNEIAALCVLQLDW